MQHLAIMATGINTSLGILPGSAADQLGNQVTDETEEERKKRLKLLQQQQGPGSALGAVSSLFGGGLGSGLGA
jgi:hypothetical protein